MLEACPQLFSFFKHEFQASLVNTVKILSIYTYIRTCILTYMLTGLH